MNEQRAPFGIEWTRIRTILGIVLRGFTWNALTGCFHDCEWNIAGQRAECYAKTIADKFAQHYPNGFASYYWHPNRLEEPLRLTERAGIFPDSMSDLFGHWVEDEHLFAVMDVMKATPHIYQCLTKNAVGYRKHSSDLPANLWAGVSSPPDHMYGNELSSLQKTRYLHTSFGVLSELAGQGQTTWMSFEPLSQDWARLVAEYPGALKWAVIGAASNGRKQYPPEERHVRNLIAVLDEQNVPVFYKGNMKSLAWASDHWREQFPEVA